MDKLFKIPVFEDFKKVTDEILSNLYSMDNHEPYILSEDDIKQTKEDIKKCVIETNFDIDSMPNLLESKQYSKEKVLYFISSLKQRKSELLLSALIHFNSAYGETVQDFDWLLKLVIGTSELKTLKYPLLQLLLVTVTKTGNKDKKVYDITKDMLDKMIIVLEEAISS